MLHSAKEITDQYLKQSSYFFLTMLPYTISGHYIK